MIFEKMFNEYIDFDDEVFSESEKGKIKLFANKLFKESIIKFTVKIISPNRIQIKYILANISNLETDMFKQLTNDDIKNIVYNTILLNPIKSIYTKTNNHL
jgi:hypothetical protein